MNSRKSSSELHRRTMACVLPCSQTHTTVKVKLNNEDETTKCWLRLMLHQEGERMNHGRDRPNLEGRVSYPKTTGSRPLKPTPYCAVFFIQQWDSLSPKMSIRLCVSRIKTPEDKEEKRHSKLGKEQCLTWVIANTCNSHNQEPNAGGS